MNNYGVFSRNQLKYIAALAMLTDHFGYLFLSVETPLGFLCRLIGRLTCPIMCYFLAQGFAYTSSRKKYALRLLAFAILSQPIFSVLKSGTFFSTSLNMLFTLLVSFLILWCYEDIPHSIWKWVPILALLFVARYCDWGTLAPISVLAFYLFRKKKWMQMTAFACIAAVYAARRILPAFKPYLLIHLGLFAAIGLLLLYNGKRGSGQAFHKWFFYVFYPLHILVLLLIRIYLF